MSIISDLHNISNDKALSFDERLDRLLETGTTLLNLETGIVSSIRGDSYQVLSVHNPDAAITPGMRFPLADIPQTFENHKVLIVEDNEINQLVIREQLRDIGLSADLAENGEEAVKFEQDAYETGDIYSIILMDCHMPVMDGLEATKQIRLLEGDTKRVPMVAVTANVLADDKEKCLNSGMDDFISKPVGTDSLKKCTFRHINIAFSDRENGLKAPA